ncbi:MAG TPA: HAD family phosphatase [Thermoanaerobaculia bacterium]|jgi:beta-phosphoglucomutase-like phosphatase (HAD superfamily)|nr:HAD family phosphatase [Thermoanaerobaculia bacterium]
MSDHSQRVASPEAVLFDCDGVILDSEILWDQAEAEFLARRGIAFDSARTKPLITGLGMTAGILLLQEQYGLKGDIEELSRERIEIVRGLFERELLFTEGFPEFFETKVRGRFRTCVATSMSADIFAVADRRLGISRLFDGRVYFPSHVGGRAKPEPDLFLYAAAQLATPPERCVVIEDSPRGIEAGRRAGMRVIGLATTHPRELIANADVVVGSFAEMDVLR